LSIFFAFSSSLTRLKQIYLRDWASKLSNASILSVDYRLQDAFPGALQDVLDAYLTVTGFSFGRQTEPASQAQQTLGFRPKRVLLLGDSCGGNLTMGLLCILNEIRRLWPDQAPLMPFAVCSIYPVFDLRAVCSASRMLGAFDPILHNGNLLSMHGCYGGMQAGMYHFNLFSTP
jgi:acetyl esterase/lipase